jgi:alkylated DNA repair protein (DNA oxidative demethylase)
MTRADPAIRNDLFESVSPSPNRRDDLQLERGAMLLRGFAAEEAPALLNAIEHVASLSPFRQMTTVRGWRMSVAMTNCGETGWLSDRNGYRYDPVDPQTNRHWPPLPNVFADIAVSAAGAAGFEHFVPDVCLINRYKPGDRLSLHQDINERDFDAPIVSISLGVPATFLWGGTARAARPRRVRLYHGDIVVWGGIARLNFHGIDRLRDDRHVLTGNVRFNLTLRRAR